MKTLLQYISSIEKISLNEYINEDNNLDKVQMEVDDMKSNESDQLSKIDADAVKSLLINNDALGNLVTVVSKKNGTYTLKFAKEDFIKDSKIANNIIAICKYFKETMGAKEIKIDNKKYTLEIK
jgi:hypothetical protein